MPITTDNTGRQAQATLTTSQKQVQRSGVALTTGLVILQWHAGEAGTVYARLGPTSQTADGGLPGSSDVVRHLQPTIEGHAIWLRGQSLALSASEDTEVTLDILPEPW